MGISRLVILALACALALGPALRPAWGHGGDFDDDGFADEVDNCPWVANPDQIDTDGNGVGDFCQCGDVNGDGVTNTVDALTIARGELAAQDPFFDRCDVNGDGVCNVTDALAIARGEVGSAPEEQLCPAYGASCAGQAFDSTFDAIQHVIFNSDVYQCNNTVCHDAVVPTGQLDLTEGFAHGNLVDVQTFIDPSFKRVQPGDHELSYLWRKLASKTLDPGDPEFPDDPPIFGLPMPFVVGIALTAEHLEAIKLWIRGGAPESGVIEGTAELLETCLPDPIPIEIVAPDPPPEDEGTQFHMPQYDIQPVADGGGEREVCYATYYDFRRRCRGGSTVGELCDPATAAAECDCGSPVPGGSIDPSGLWFYYRDYELTQNPNSHHSINTVYIPFPTCKNPGSWGEPCDPADPTNCPGSCVSPTADVDDPDWGAFTCKGGETAGEACDPKDPVNCPTSCASPVVDAVACVGFGPSDLDTNSIGYSGAQEPFSSPNFPFGVFNRMPMKGILVWNSHAFNLTDHIQPMESWVNIYYAPPADQVWQAQQIFDARHIWKIGATPVPLNEFGGRLFPANPLCAFGYDGDCNWVPPFQREQGCTTYTLPRYARLFELSSHFHRRGVLFEIFDPIDERIYASTEYNDPVVLNFDPPIALDSADAADRTYRYCATYDNGFTDPSDVKRMSTTPPNSLVTCTPTHCAEGRIGEPCETDAECDTSIGSGDGACDACPLWGGVSTEDEMFILLGNYYVDAP
jgi:hypothetical protein